MSDSVSLLLCLSGFAALAAATDRVQEELLGRACSHGRVRLLRVAGWTLLLGALGWVVAHKGWSLGVVSYSGHTSVSAGLVYLVLILVHRMRFSLSARADMRRRR
ncbi:DUF3325 domain-containing protein [Aquincola tertiaricarbonis]|uniref:DUF3325 domain-containing protein n=1 Tax=Aquincola tertiaricarbonis TaxID=391953 RepID=UPI0006152D2E|nr:DUF3325 domain-containing protein [Aquincola tertiaricarbonis]